MSIKESNQALAEYVVGYGSDQLFEKKRFPLRSNLKILIVKGWNQFNCGRCSVTQKDHDYDTNSTRKKISIGSKRL